MRKLLLVLAVALLSLSANAQELFVTPSSEGEQLEGQYVVIVNELSSSENYFKLLKYVSESYNSPEEVVKHKEENSYLRIEGISKIFSHKEGGRLLPVKYHLEFKFKDNKTKMEIVSFKSGESSSEMSGWVTYSNMYKKDGRVKKEYYKYGTRVVASANYLLEEIKSKLNESTSEDW